MRTNFQQQLALMEQSGRAAINEGLFFVTPDSTPFHDGKFDVNGKAMINLSSCSYLGLELDPRLAQGASLAASQYGTQYSSCRAFAQCPLYEELEILLERIFHAPVTVNLSTAIGHIATLPILVDDADHLVLDIQSHHCLKLTSDYLVHRGITNQTIRHNDLSALTDILTTRKGQTVWYLIDGLYSMYGDYAPIPELLALLDSYPNLKLYVDDAHGLSWYGKHGRGYALECGQHERMYVAHSFTKAFGAGGGCVVFPDKASRDRVRLLGGPFYWGSPVSPPVLGAAVASAKLHLDGTVTRLQADLSERVTLFNRLCEKWNVPLIANNATPIRYIGLGKQDVTNKIAKALMEKGFYASAVCYPSVSKNRTGLRLGITNHLSFSDIHTLVETLSDLLDTYLSAEEVAFIEKAFKRAF
ncbi:aminotransferase class I/II-fold pyridoxal phosphate-dependent enzyme [Aestuariibacter sp. AA17]|uniref:Aminotransferase class I/II-fold pyridoxal phosphate-dependent enzyme n=1 Tax=Fluctibacter corallii TaxID=2984329 RepID=A0ABT3ACM5_9ALTE|nr:aminotransferase class I/II-fold pyridoxal phosphate-dependent enzyme [Aestuariibacter sp. AA17]MCV2886422.1 aminotransferase class I/II-fold pyridoxal phosphate-dependent enzyme [Aestuariibacter sp. AA17]